MMALSATPLPCPTPTIDILPNDPLQDTARHGRTRVPGLGQRVPGLGQMNWRIVLTKKMRGHSGKKNSRKSRNSCCVNGGGVGAHGQLTPGPNVHSPETKYKRSKNAFSVTFIALNCVRMCSRLLQLLAQSLIGSPGTLAVCKRFHDEMRPSHPVVEVSHTALDQGT